MAELLLFVFLGLFSPGPNVILITTSGARFGIKATLPHVAGVVLGVGITAGVTGFGVAQILASLPGLRLALTVISAGWILWLAWRLWTADPARQSARARPFTVVEAILFQWVNPKVWAVALAATAFLPDRSPVEQAALLAVAFSGINLGVCLFWSVAGALLAFLLSNPAAWRLFMQAMAVALVFFSALVFF